MAADGQSPTFDVAFTPLAMSAWFEAARHAMARGTPGIALGACVACHAPLTVSRRLHVELTCPHCSSVRQGLASEILFDQWTEPWTSAKGTHFDLEYRLVWNDGSEQGGGCPACGAPTPLEAPSHRCHRCHAVAWVGEAGPATAAIEPNPSFPRAAGQRRQLAVRVDGTRGGRSIRLTLAIPAGLAALRADAAAGAAHSTERSVLGIVGVGCVSLIALVVLSTTLLIAFVKAC